MSIGCGSLCWWVGVNRVRVIMLVGGWVSIGCWSLCWCEGVNRVWIIMLVGGCQ